MGLLDTLKKKKAAMGSPAANSAVWSRRPEPGGTNNLVVVILDSCRHDLFRQANSAMIARPFGGISKVERRFSYAAWTAPSHYNLLIGLMPHASPPHVFASNHYKREFRRYNERLGTSASDSIDFSSLVPHLWLPTFLKRKLGYRTHAMVSMPVLNPMTPVNLDFDTYELMPEHNDMGKMLDKIEEGGIFSEDRPSFVLMNVGETHYPYTIPGDDPDELASLATIHGLRLEPEEGGGRGQESGERSFDPAQMVPFRDRQVRAIEHLSREIFPRLFDILPRNTHLVVTSDHGELFGEGGYFGHGPILHDKVLEVPFLEGKIR